MLNITEDPYPLLCEEIRLREKARLRKFWSPDVLLENLPDRGSVVRFSWIGHAPPWTLTHEEFDFVNKIVSYCHVSWRQFSLYRDIGLMILGLNVMLKIADSYTYVRLVILNYTVLMDGYFCDMWSVGFLGGRGVSQNCWLYQSNQINISNLHSVWYVHFSLFIWQNTCCDYPSERKFVMWDYSFRLK